MRINSLMTRFNSLLGANKFPVPMRRELGRKTLNLALDSEPVVHWQAATNKITLSHLGRRWACFQSQSPPSDGDFAMMPALIIALVLTLSSPALAASVYTHCKVNEMVVYSCSTGSHILSLCASPDISKNQGYLQYRYGLRGKPELVYPETFQHPAGLFKPGNLMFSGGGGTYLQFNKREASPTPSFRRSANGGKAVSPHRRKPGPVCVESKA